MVPMVIGADPETGEPLALPLITETGASRILVVAPSGEGKSMLLDDIRERITACDDARLIQINLSKGVEDSWWAPLAEASALASDENPPGKAQAILDFATDAIKLRPSAPARKAGARTHMPTPAEPLFVVIVDEADAAAADPERKAALEAIESKCRSEGWALILASQRPAGKWVSTSLRANLTHLVWSKMRANDARNAAGNENFELPDMGTYGGANKGIFGICEHPVFPGMAYQRGRSFFWGDASPGLLKLIKARAAERVPYVLEPALAPLAGQWAAITGAGPLSGDRYDVATTRAGQTVPGVAGVRGKLAAVAGMLGGPESPQDGPGPAPTPVPAPGLDDDVRVTLLTLAGRPAGVSRGEAVDATPYAKTKIHEVFAELCQVRPARAARRGPRRPLLHRPPAARGPRCRPGRGRLVTGPAIVRRSSADRPRRSSAGPIRPGCTTGPESSADDPAPAPPLLRKDRS